MKFNLNTMENKIEMSGRKFRFFVGIILLFIGILSFMSCHTGKVLSEVAEDRDVEDEYLVDLVAEREFQIKNEWAMPLRGSSINLIGNPNYIRFEGDSVDVALPYFGYRHIGGGYGSEAGIEFEGLVEELRIEKEPDEITMHFEADQGSEHLNFSIIVYADGTAHTSVTSSERDAISYRGFVTPLPEEIKE